MNVAGSPPLNVTGCRYVLLLAAGLMQFGAAVFAKDAADLLVARSNARTPQEEQRAFHLPSGFKIELVACEPDIIKPINMKFDGAGRLYVTQSVEYPFPHAAGAPGRDTIRRLVDSNGDGIPDRVSIYADGLSIPIGVTPIPNGLLAYSIPNLYRLLDTNGDGKADQRQIAYSGFGHHDTHGMINGLNYWIDGWIYGCHGFSNTSTVAGTDGQSITMQSGNTYRLRLDGSHIEHFSFGQVNPFGMTFNARGDIYTADCHTRPATVILRGGYYQSFGKPHDGLGFAPELMQHGHGSTGICGVVVYEGQGFPSQYQNTLFLCNPVTGCVNHDRIAMHGSTQVGIEQPDFLTCDDPWFRPVDLQLAADGSIYMADFYNCIIGHYEVPLTHPRRDRTHGRIWRISYVGQQAKTAAHPKPLNLSTAAIKQVFGALADVNTGVRIRATQELVNRFGKEAIPPAREIARSHGNPLQRAHTLWVLFRLGALDPRLLSSLLGDSEAIVRLHAVKALGERQPWSSSDRALAFQKLTDADPFVRRAAADALSTHPDLANLEPLARLWRDTEPADAMLIHMSRIAMRNALRSAANLRPLVTEYQKSKDMQRRLIDVAFGDRRPQSAEFLYALLAADPHVSPRAAEALGFIANSIEARRLPDVQRLALQYHEDSRDAQRAVLLAIFRTCRERGVAVSDELKAWAKALVAELLGERQRGAIRQGIELAAETRLPSSIEPLERIISAAKVAGLRGAASEALVRVDENAALPVIERIVSSPETPLAVRCDLVESLRSVNNQRCRAFLAAQLQTAPSRLAASLVDTLGRSREGAIELLAAVEKGHCSARLLADRGVRGRLHAVATPALDSRIDKLLEGIPSPDERIAKRIAADAAAFAKGNKSVERGISVFEKNCAACHQIGGKGNRVGPQLDGIGNRGVDRLFEDILDPNRNVDANFRASILALNDGQILNGLVVREEGPVLVVVDSKGKEQRIAKDKIEQRTQSKLSPMPANVIDLLGRQELFDLVAYLRTQRAPGEANR